MIYSHQSALVECRFDLLTSNTMSDAHLDNGSNQATLPLCVGGKACSSGDIFHTLSYNRRFDW